MDRPEFRRHPREGRGEPREQDDRLERRDAGDEGDIRPVA